MFEENFLTYGFNELGYLTHWIYGEDYGKTVSMKSLNEDLLKLKIGCQMEVLI